MPELPSDRCKILRPHLKRRHLLAAAPGLALALSPGKSARAEIAEADLPSAMDVLTPLTPQRPPPLTFTNAKGKKLTLASFSGHALVANLWATWCGPCIAEIPSFSALATKLKAKGVLILPISIDVEGEAAVRPFYASHHIRNLPILLNPDGTDMDLLKTDGVPTTIVINHQGQLVARADGAANWNTPDTIAYLQNLGPRAAPDPGVIPVREMPG